ncbi:MAG: hypothetical protein U9N73_05285 [Candidatus Auribacterota bacterium]|nr:hypothetical protein [Candidatus Auribacterota bacterium]
MKKKPLIIFSSLLLTTLILSLPLIINPALKTRSDAVIHIGITRAILRNGIPPPNPFLAGEKLPYYWFYNALAALICLLSGFDAGAVLIILNILGLFFLLLLSYKITVFISGRTGRGVLAAALVIFGLNGWGWLLLIPGFLRNGISSVSPLLTNGIWGFLDRIVITRWEGTMGFMLTKFWVANSFSLGLVGVAAAIYYLFQYNHRQKTGSLILFLFFTLLSAHLNILAGGILLIISLSFFLYRLILPSRKKDVGKKSAVIVFILIAILIPLLIPYLNSIMDETSQTHPIIRFRLPDLFQLRVLTVILAPLWILAAITFRLRGDRTTRLYRYFLLLSILLLSAGFLFCRFPKHNEFKLLFLIALFLSLLIGLNAGLTNRKISWIVWGILLTTIPTTGLGLIAYSYSPDEHLITHDETAVYTWINRNLPADTVLIAERRNDLIPLLADRDAYLSCYTFLKSTPIDRSLIKNRRNRIRNLGDQEKMTKTLIEISRETGRPVSLIRYSGDLSPKSPLLLLHTEGEIKVWKIER